MKVDEVKLKKNSMENNLAEIFDLRQIYTMANNVDLEYALIQLGYIK